MSTTEAGSADDAGRKAATAVPASPPAPKRAETPIVPQSTIAGRALVAVVAIMTFLASLTTGAALLVRVAASDWQSDVSREVTIQVRPTAGRDIEADVARAVALTRGYSGIADVRPYSKEEAAHLLEPWLGTGLKLDDLPVPRIIMVRIARGARPDLATLRAALATELPSASLDDHRSFIERMRAMSGAAMIGGIAVLALVLTATILSVTFATRAAMAMNRPVIEVLHLIGAKNNFIAENFQRHFLELGLKGGAAGGGLAIVLFAFAQIMSSRTAATPDGGQFTALFGVFSLGVWGYVAVIAQVVLIAVVTAATSRYTVNRTIETMR
jgi:cell division transport system permease protein